MSVFSELQILYEELLAKQQNKGTRKLRELIHDNLSNEELQLLGLDLGVNLDDLPGESSKIKVQEIIRWAERYGLSEQLIHSLKELRPEIEWPELESVDVAEAEAFIKEARQKSTQIFSLSEREQLQANLSYWAWYVNEKTGNKPNDELLQPHLPSKLSGLRSFNWWIAILTLLSLFVIWMLIIQSNNSTGIITPTPLPTHENALVVITSTPTEEPTLEPSSTPLPTETPTSTPMPTATNTPDLVPFCVVDVTTANNSREEAFPIEPNIRYCGQFDDERDVYSILVTEYVTGTITLENPLIPPDYEPAESKLALFTSEDEQIEADVQPKRIQKIDFFLEPGEYFIIVDSSTRALTFFTYSLSWSFSVVEKPIDTPEPTPTWTPIPTSTPFPAMLTPVITHLEILPGGALIISWIWEGTLDVDQNFAVRLWSRTDPRPEARYSITWTKETSYEFSIYSYPPGEYLMNVAVMEGPSSGEHIELVRSQDVLVYIPPVEPTLPPP